LISVIIMQPYNIYVGPPIEKEVENGAMEIF
jgi:hypothetical protein